ncbi:phosphoenolpyruvate mutase [Actinoallomurus spadix]|uniref:phosphoenolpyruvate mutase n=1 Tax=Actinoallomurus spadix TaxID=79912 RepID=A0ABP3FSD6_9ACTN|nr:phosphoenolpyruvate mutase [Actinoallomurus spadix]MCO5985380.1 phosphoenolpyruvate mutase [Actinoallomurus spadix]
MDESLAVTSPGHGLRSLLTGAEPCQIMGVYNGLSARIATAAGFPALWASGLCMSTALGVRDSDEATWSELLAVVETMTANTPAPVLVDADTGYGNFNTARRFSIKAERVGVAGICIEDKIFPKMNSFVGDDHRLAPVGEFCGKIAACKDAQNDDGFVVVARVEALIAGRSVAEALDRADRYREAGADAIFIHSRQSTVEQIADFARQWGGRAPLVIAPTTYYATSLEEFGRLGINGVIWANQTLRAEVAAVRDACSRILQSGGVAAIEAEITPLKEIFALMRYEELEAEELRYADVGAHLAARPVPASAGDAL